MQIEGASARHVGRATALVESTSQEAKTEECDGLRCTGTDFKGQEFDQVVGRQPTVPCSTSPQRPEAARGWPRINGRKWHTRSKTHDGSTTFRQPALS